MISTPRLGILALCGWLGCLTLGISLNASLADEAKQPTSVRPVQYFQQAPVQQTPEPPLAEPGRANVVPVPQPRIPFQPIPVPTQPIPVPAPAPEVFHEDPPTPVVSIRVRVPATAAAGQELEYHICVENQSTAPAHHVIVRNPLPANARYVRANPEPMAKEPELIWNLGTLEACGCREITLVLSPTGTGDVHDCARVQFEHGQCVTTRIARPAIVLRKNGPAQAAVNSTLNYQITVTNTGGTELTGVVLTDKLPPGLTHVSGRQDLNWELGTLLPGQSRTVDYQVTATSAGRFRNKATVTAAGGLRDEVEHEVQVAEIKIGLTMTGPATAIINANVAYQLTVSNGGSLPLTDVVITNPVPAQMTFVSAGSGGLLVRPLGPAPGPNAVQWAIGTLEPGASRAVEVVFRSSSPGRICNQARATAAGGLSAQAEACTMFEGQAGLVIAVAPTVDPIEVGGQTSYPIVVRNTGFARVTNVRIQADVPQELDVTDVKSPLGSSYRKEGPILKFDPINLEPGQEARYVVSVRANKAGDLRFKVEMYADQLTSGKPVYREASTTVANKLSNGQVKPQKRIIEAL